MQQYLITAKDGTDSGAYERRMTARPFHFARARELKAAGNFVTGGAVLNDKGEMTGSMMVVQFESPQELKKWMDTEPYIVGKVWEKVEVKLFKVADV